MICLEYLLSYGLTIIAFFITIIAQVFVSSTYHKYSKVSNERNITGAEAARYILNKNGLNNIKIVKVNGYLTDHYDQEAKVIRLSSTVYDVNSVGAVAVASHECGHAIQDKEGYKFLKFRSALIPIVNFSSYAGYLALILGIFFSSLNLIWLGIILELVILLFQFITLPVEINASKIALKELDYSHILNSRELKNGKTMLIAAAFTYVASVITTLIQILRLILLFGKRED